MKIRPVPGWTAKQNGLRSPIAQMARYFPLAMEKNGLSEGMVPSALSRSSFPWVVVSDWAFEPMALSPVATYSLPSAPK
jgi:hypothetical protein